MYCGLEITCNVFFDIGLMTDGSISYNSDMVIKHFKIKSFISVTSLQREKENLPKQVVYP